MGLKLLFPCQGRLECSIYFRFAKEYSAATESQDHIGFSIHLRGFKCATFHDFSDDKLTFPESKGNASSSIRRAGYENPPEIQPQTLKLIHRWILAF